MLFINLFVVYLSCNNSINKKINTMRTEIFTEAWRLFRMYSTTFAHALRCAWAKYNTDKLNSKLSLMEVTSYTYEQKSELKEFNAYVTKKWAVRMELLSVLELRVSFTPDIELWLSK